MLNDLSVRLTTKADHNRVRREPIPADAPGAVSRGKRGIRQPARILQVRGHTPGVGCARLWPRVRVTDVPHSCQNTPTLTVIGGHSGDMRRRGDLGSGRYQCRPNKPDKEEIIRRAYACAGNIGSCP